MFTNPMMYFSLLLKLVGSHCYQVNKLKIAKEIIIKERNKKKKWGKISKFASHACTKPMIVNVLVSQMILVTSLGYISHPCFHLFC